MRYLVAIFSAIVWGSGQLMNKQPVKALIFFVFQIMLISIELFTGTIWVLTGQSYAAFRNCGMFTKGIWGLITLGTIPMKTTDTQVYDHSIMLMINGLIAVFILAIFILIYIWNIKDAYKTRIDMENGITIDSKQYFQKMWDKSFEYIMITPAVLLMLFVLVVPIVFILLISFTNYTASNIPPRHLVSWTGFQAYANVFTIKGWAGTFVGVFIWTLEYAIIGTLSIYVFGMLQAVLIQNKFIKGRKIWRGIFILPWAIPAFVSIMVFKTMLDITGPINTMLIDAGVIKTGIGFLSNTGWAKASILIVSLWLGWPYFMTLISGILGTIPEEIYEAAVIDGANGWDKFKGITLPLVIQATAPLVIFNFTFNFNNFGLIYFLTEGGPENINYQVAGSTDILITWIYKLTLDKRLYNIAAVMSIFIFIVIASVSTYNLVKTKVFKED